LFARASSRSGFNDNPPIPNKFLEDVPIGWQRGILGLDPKGIQKKEIHEFLIKRLVLGP
jgi:hypothetical protein